MLNSNSRSLCPFADNNTFPPQGAPLRTRLVRKYRAALGRGNIAAALVGLIKKRTVVARTNAVRRTFRSTGRIAGFPHINIPGLQRTPTRPARCGFLRAKSGPFCRRRGTEPVFPHTSCAVSVRPVHRTLRACSCNPYHISAPSRTLCPACGTVYPLYCPVPVILKPLQSLQHIHGVDIQPQPQLPAARHSSAHLMKYRPYPGPFRAFKSPLKPLASPEQRQG